MNNKKQLFLIFSLLALSACGVTISKKPDLNRIYSSTDLSENSSPIIIIPGLMGTTLADDLGAEVFPKSVSNLAFSDYAVLADANKKIGPAKLLEGVAGVDFYGQLLSVLKSAGRYEQGELNTPVQNTKIRRYYILLYDWRRSNRHAINQLHAMIDQIRKDYQDPNLKVDIVAHSNGGLIARYYLQYGPQTESSWINPSSWSDGENRVRRFAILGTPNLGSIVSVSRLINGFKLTLKTIPPEILVNFVTPFETLPNPNYNVFINNIGEPLAVDIYDHAIWKKNKWSIYSDEIQNRIAEDASKPENYMEQLDKTFVVNLASAKAFQQALSNPLGGTKTEIAVFGGDCELTPTRAILEQQNNLLVPIFDYEKLSVKQKGVDYEHLMLAPGDGLVTRESELASRVDPKFNPKLQTRLFPIVQATFLCEKHELLTANSYFQNNLLYFIFH